ncbi:MAG TPA: sigma-70 family RNA polymerase sigma factor [Candidatus Sulfotelmatobacter sp.]|nr:sigma-70 family RNA polymerase sigma factor [Candidatus Sulfotelmatobacter sp.]
MSAAPVTFTSEFRLLRSGPRPTLISRARRGDREAFTEMVSPYVPTLLQRARRVTGNVADAEDVRQETLLKAWSRLDQFSGSCDENTDDFRAWLARIAGNTSIDTLRQRRDGKHLSLEEPRGNSEESLASLLEAKSANPEEQCARREMGRMLADAILQLPADLRQACLLRDVMHYSTQEVAERLSISVVAVRLRLFRARRRLREKMEQSLQPKARAARTTVQRHSARPAEASRGRRSLLGLNTAVGFASGD